MTDKVQMLVDSLRYQILTPRVSTWGQCANGCGHSARGASRCRRCLVEELAQHVGLLADSLERELTKLAEQCRVVEDVQEAIQEAANAGAGL